MRAGILAVAVALFSWGGALGCGGSGKRASAPLTGNGQVVPAGPRELVLYRDGALVRERYPVELVAGDTVLAIAIPPDVEAGEIEARVVSGDGRVGTITLVEPALIAGDAIEVRDGERVIRGILRYNGGRELVVDVDGVTRVLLDARHVVRGEGGGARRRIDVAVASTGTGKAVVEIVYVTRRLSWVADYTLIMDSASKVAELHGALGIDNTAGIEFADAAITLVDSDRPVKITAFDAAGASGAIGAGGKPDPSKPVGDPTKPRAEQPVTPPAKPVEKPRTTLPFTVDVLPGAQSVSLLAGSHVLPAEQTLVFDPVGEERNLSGRSPIYDRSYGLDRKSTAVSQSIDVDLVAGRVPQGLPAGTVRMVERQATGELTPLGEARIFERTGSGTDKVSPTTSVAVGRASQVEGKRIRREYTLDDGAKRLTEEFEIELTSKADHPVDVIVREHMYRGLNWTLGYHNVGRRVAKEGPQKVALRTTVPANGTARVIYRVVYHW